MSMFRWCSVSWTGNIHAANFDYQCLAKMEECDHYGKAQNEHIGNFAYSLKMGTIMPSGISIHSSASHIVLIVNPHTIERRTTKQHAQQNVRAAAEWAMDFPASLKIIT
jgi:predicted aldo/keto reductase-like oxidoreductase